MLRNDFVSNSSSTSFILNKDDKEFEKLFPKYKKYSWLKVKNEFQKLKDCLTSFQENVKNNIGMDEYIYQTLFSESYYGIINLISDINNEIMDMHELQDEDVYITEPVDRDYAYTMGYENTIFKGDL